MQAQRVRPTLLLLVSSFGVLWPIFAWSQAARPQSRIVQPVDEGVRVTLRGNTHPLAQAQFDRGAAPPDLPMAGMLLVLKRSEAQEAALEKLLDDQQDQSSPNYHQWLTPDQFGQQFGPSDQDIQAVTAWLRSHGFQIGQVGRGRTVIEFSGTALQVQQAFRTEIHEFTANGEDHWANASDPQIPAALTPAVVGVASLHNFPKKPMHQIAGIFSREKSTGRVQVLQSEFTPANSSVCPGSGNCYFVGPYDFAKIYNVEPLWNAGIDGTGQNIAIVSESNINLQDVRDFRNLFQLPANDPQIYLNGPDPGIVQGPELEALLDVEWAGAVAKGATIKLVATAPTNSTEGADLSAVYAVENNLAPIVSESFGECELFLGAAGNSFENAIRQQAAAQGITFINSSGDEGSARCDPVIGKPPTPATHGLMVSGLASTPYNVAVGGTDFLNFGTSYNVNSPSLYWSTSNDVHQASALGYVPETTWNSNCTNAAFVVLGAGSTPEAVCNNPRLSSDAIQTLAGGGGTSNCIKPSGAQPSSCTGGYPRPSWQTAPGVPPGVARLIPDVSLFASRGFMGSAYVVCEVDVLPIPPCNLNDPFVTFLAVGGTSASAPAFAGIVALVNQYTQSSGQGNANYVLYKLAGSLAQTAQACGATSNPSSSCIFYDVTFGTNTVPCARNSPDCNLSNPSDTYGVLSGYSAEAGYDLATGLGSVNAYNLVHNWIGPTTPSTTTLSLAPQNGTSPISITHGQSVTFNISVTPNTATGTVSLVGLPGGSGTAVAPMASFALQNGVASGSTTALGGGNSYGVKAHYSGDGTYQPSDSPAVTVTVAPEASKTIITLPTFDSTGKETGNTPTSVVYGTPLGLRVDVGNSQASQTFPERGLCAPLTCPTGSVTLTDSLNNGPPLPLIPASVVALNSGGFAEPPIVPLFSGGTHQLTASYPGDNSYQNSVGSYGITVTPAATRILPPSPGCGSTCFVGAPIPLLGTVIATTSFVGAGITGEITFYDATAQLGVVTINGPGGSTSSPALAQSSIMATFTTGGTHQISATYSGDANYGPASSSPTGISVVYATSGVLMASRGTVNLGQSVTVTATVTGASKTPPMTGTLQFSSAPPPTISVTGVSGTDSNGNQTLTATTSITPQVDGEIDVYYPGDANYGPTRASVFVTVNLPGFNMNINGPGPTITAGQSGSTVLTLTPVTNISSSVALTCNSTVAGSTCSFNPPSPIALSGGAAASTTITITTLPPSSSPTTTLIGSRPRRSPGIPPLGRWTLGFADALIAFVLLTFSGKRRRLAARLGFAGFLCLVLGCGAGGNGGDGGGGGRGSTPPTSLTLTVSTVKAAYGVTPNLTATLNSGGNPTTGTITFFDSGLPFFSTGASHIVSFGLPGLNVGTHVISAQYSGDSNNQPSTSGSINLVITGSTWVFVTGTSPGVSNNTQFPVTIQ